MHIRFIRWAIGTVAALSLVGAASMTQAAGLTPTQIQAILSLLQSFGADQSVINNVNAALGGQPSSSGISCVDLTYNLFQGKSDATTNGEVSKLQQFLGVSATGYFGPMTEQAVQQYQSQHGIVSSGSPDTTGYGAVGPQTRTSMGCGNQPQNSDTAIAVTIPASGQSFSAGDAMNIQWTDNGPSINSPHYSIVLWPSTYPQGSGWPIAGSGYGMQDVTNTNYTWTVTAQPPAGQYIVRVCRLGENVCGRSGVISIGAQTNQPTATIDQSSLTATSGNGLTITGSANGASSVLVSVYAPNQNGTNLAVVANGQWSTTVYPKAEDAFPAGAYTVTVYNCTAGYLNCASALGPVLTTGTLTVTGSQTNSSLTASPTSGAAPLTVTFTGNAPADYMLDFGDGSSASQVGEVGTLALNLSHTYNNAGSYTAKLTEGPNGRILATAEIIVSSSNNATAPQLLTMTPNSISNNSSATLTGSGFSMPGASLEVDGLYSFEQVNGNNAPSSNNSETVNFGYLIDPTCRTDACTPSNTPVTLSAGQHTIALKNVYGTSAPLTFTVTCGASAVSGANCGAPAVGAPTCSVLVSPTPSIIGQPTKIIFKSTNTTGAQWVQNSDYTALQNGYHLGGPSVPTSGFVEDSFNGVTPGTYNLSATFQGQNGSSVTCPLTLNLQAASGSNDGLGLTATPTSGSAPLGVAFTYTNKTVSTNLSAIDFGDGSTGIVSAPAGSGDCISAPCTYYANHTYTRAGTYTASITDASQCDAAVAAHQECLPGPQHVTVVVSAAADPKTTFIAHLYQCILNRAPDSPSLAYWTSRPVSTALGYFYTGFFTSSEYTAKNVSNNDYINQLYTCVLNRPGDAGGVQYWMNQLNSGTSRDSVLNSFLSSSEFLSGQGAYWSGQTGYPVLSPSTAPQAAVTYPAAGSTIDLNGTQSATADTLPGSQAFTVAAWVKFAGTGCGIVLSDATNAIANDMFLGVDATHVYVRADKSGATLSGGGCLQSASLNLPTNIANAWHHLVWVNTGTNSIIYLDGKSVGSVSLPGSNVGYSGATTIGTFFDGTNGYYPHGANFFVGSLASVQYFTTALSAGQVSQLYNGGASSPTTFSA